MTQDTDCYEQRTDEAVPRWDKGLNFGGNYVRQKKSGTSLTLKPELFPLELKGKGKVHPRTGHEGPEGEQMYSSTLPSTSALDGGGWSTPQPGRFTPGKDPVPIVQEAGWATGPVWTGAEKSRSRRDSMPGPSRP